MECPFCKYIWEETTPKPKGCPKCGQRLDRKNGYVGIPTIFKKVEEFKL